MLISMRLHIHADYYSDSTLLKEIYESNKEKYSNFKTFFSICVSEDTFETTMNGKKYSLGDVVRAEALHNCSNGTWASMLCLLASSDVLQRKIRSHYPPFGDSRVVTILNTTIDPDSAASVYKELHLSDAPTIDILWSRTTLSSEGTFKYKPNHFVPLFAVKGHDYAQKTKMKATKQKSMAGAFQSELKNARISTAKGRSVKFDKSASILAHFNPFKSKTSLKPATSTSSLQHQPSTSSDDSLQHQPSSSSTEPSFSLDENSRKRKLAPDNNADIFTRVEIKQPKFEETIYPAVQHTIYQRGMKLFKDNEVSKYDIGLFLGKKLSSCEMFDVIQNLWKPEETYEYPITMEGSGLGKPKRKKRFVKNWLKQYNWLAYSKLYDGAFCIPCVFFGHSHGHNGEKLCNLYSQPLTFWTSASTKLANHNCPKPSGGSLHGEAVLRMTSFLMVKRGRAQAINVELDNRRKLQIQKNRSKLSSIAKSVAFCGKQTIALRGHRDDETVKDTSWNMGNFQELLNFRVDSGDEILEEHFRTAPKNATYKSKTTQNELIECFGNQITDRIISEVKKGGIFSIIADETPDIAKREQLALSLRFVDSNGLIQEKFIKFIECDTGTSANAIVEKLKTALRDLGLEVKDIRGQGYDGASNMSGQKAGVAKVFNDENPFALFVHCFAHRLNLVVADACKLIVIKNMMDTVRCVSEFFEYPKRAELLREYIIKYTPENLHETLLDVCKTRWIARIDGLERFEDMYEVIMMTLQTIRDNMGGHWNDDSRNLASSLFNACSEFSFLLALVVAKYFLYLLLPLTAGLQEREIDIMKAYGQVNFVKKCLQEGKARIETVHKELFARAKVMGDFTGSQPKIPRVCNRSAYRHNYNISNEEDYYRVATTIPFLNYIINEIDERFGNEPSTVVKGFSIVPSMVVNSDSAIDDWKISFMEFAKVYENDLECMNTLVPELLMWQTYWCKEFRGDLPSTVAATLKCIFPIKSSFPNIYSALRVLATIPVTSCECERAISVLRRLKTYLRSKMGQGRLNGLALMSIHRDLPLDIDDVINRFARMHPRRMELIDILDDDESSA